METIYTTPNEQKKRSYPVSAAVLAALASVGFSLCTPFVFFCALLLPVAAALEAKVLCSRPEKLYMAVLPVLPGMIVTYLLYDGTVLELAAMSLLVPLMAVAVAFVQLRKKGGFFTALAASAACGVLLYALIFLNPLVTAGDAFATVREACEEAKPAMEEMLQMMAGTVGEGNAYVQRVKEMLPGITGLVEDMSTGLIFAFACVLGILAAVLFFRFTRKERAEWGLNAPGKFRSWSIPKDFTVGIAVLFIATLVCRLCQLEKADSVYYTVALGIFVPLCVQGLALVMFMVNNTKERRGLSVALAVCTGLFFTAVSNLLVSMGAIEQLMRIREKYAIMMKMKNDGTGGGAL